MKKTVMIIIMVMLIITRIVYGKNTETVKGLQVVEFAFCKGIGNRLPIERTNIFLKNISKIFFWTNIVGATEVKEIKHIWYFNNKKIAEVPLEVKYLRHRTWSSKIILPQWLGDWKVDVVDNLGNILKSATFKIKFPQSKLQIEQDGTINRTSVTYDLGGLLLWVVNYNGNNILRRSAGGETQYNFTHLDKKPGIYTVHLEQFVDGKYQVISDVVSYEILSPTILSNNNKDINQNHINILVKH